MYLKRSLVSLPMLLCLAACVVSPVGADKAEIVLPMQRAWVDGKLVEYVSTDISDTAMARQNGLNYVPRLSEAIPAPGRKSLVERVYKFPRGEQISVFPSAPLPAGGANADLGYSPLWRVVLVSWLAPANPRELKSEEQILGAQERGELLLQVTDIVVNCPVIRATDGSRLAGSR